MRVFLLIASIIAVALIIFNATKLNFEALLEGESFIAVATILIAFCALVLLQILRISKKIETIQK